MPSVIPDTKVSLKTVIETELKNANHPNVKKFINRLPSDIDTLDPHVQQILINRELRYALAGLEQREGIDTLNARFCVIDGAPEHDWIMTLRKGTLGLVAQYGL